MKSTVLQEEEESNYGGEENSSGNEATTEEQEMATMPHNEGGYHHIYDFNDSISSNAIHAFGGPHVVAVCYLTFLLNKY